MITLRCSACGNEIEAARADYDPPEATVMVTNECNRCHAASGGYGMSWYFDANGDEVTQ